MVDFCIFIKIFIFFIGKGARGTAIVEVSAAREGVVFVPGMS